MHIKAAFLPPCRFNAARRLTALKAKSVPNLYEIPTFRGSGKAKPVRPCRFQARRDFPGIGFSDRASDHRADHQAHHLIKKSVSRDFDGYTRAALSNFQ